MLWNFRSKKSSKKVEEYLQWQDDEDTQSFIKIAIDTGEDIPKELFPPKMPMYLHEIIDFFQKVSTQWVVSMSGLVGLDYNSVKVVSDVYRFELTPFRMEVIRLLEMRQLQKSNKKSDT